MEVTKLGKLLILFLCAQAESCCHAAVSLWIDRKILWIFTVLDKAVVHSNLLWLSSGSILLLLSLFLVFCSRGR